MLRIFTSIRVATFETFKTNFITFFNIFDVFGNNETKNKNGLLKKLEKNMPNFLRHNNDTMYRGLQQEKYNILIIFPKQSWCYAYRMLSGYYLNTKANVTD